MLKGIFLRDVQWFLILDLLENREEEIEEAESELKLCSLCIKNITARLRTVNNDSVGVILPTEGWYYILDLSDARIEDIEEGEEVVMLEEAQSIIWEGLNTDGMPFPEV